MKKILCFIVLFEISSLASCQDPNYEIIAGLTKICPNYKALEPEFQEKVGECNSTLEIFRNSSLVENLCSYTNVMTGCVEGFLKVAQKCKGEGAKQAVADVYKMLDSTMYFLCNDKGRRFAGILDDKYTTPCMQMLREKMQTFKVCLKLSELDVYLQDSKFKTCNYLSDTATCYSEGFKKCPSKDVKSFFKDAVRSPFDGLDCARQSSALGLAASPAFIVSGLLVLQVFTLL